MRYLRREYFDRKLVNVWVTCIYKHVKVSKWTIVNRKVVKKENAERTE